MRLAQHMISGPVPHIMGITFALESLLRSYKALSEWECKKTCTVKELQSLIGTLNFACKVVLSGHPFSQ